MLFDLLSALPYLVHYVIPVAFPLFLYVTAGPSRRCHRIGRFYWLLGWSMWAHYLVWFLLPTAPPWVADNVAIYRRLNSTVTPPPIDRQPREGCAFSRVDRLTGLPLFRTIFAGNPVPFASFPSGHVAWPTCVLVTQMLCGCSVRRKVLLAIYVVWVAWATMYSCHHHLSDILAAVVVVVLVDRLITCFRCHGRRRNRKLNGGNDVGGGGGCLTAIV
jgi:membrane-associated phospholipid phosphatase